MVKLPTKDALGPLPSAKTGRTIATFDTSAIGRGMASFGASMANMGAKFQAEADKQEAFRAESSFQEFMWQEELGKREFVKGLNAENVGTASQDWAAGYQQRASQFFGTVPERLKPLYDQKLFGAEQRYSTQVYNEQQAAQKQITASDYDHKAANVWSTKAREATTDELDEIVGDLDAMLEADTVHSFEEKEEIRQKKLRQIGLAHLNSLPLDDAIDILETPLEYSEAIQALTPEDRQRFYNAEEAQEEADDRTERNETRKAGYDLLFSDQMTPEWIEANKDALTVTDYKTFLRSLDPNSNRKTAPREYVRLDDLTETDPESAIEELRHLYLNDLIAKEDFKQLTNKAERQIKGELGRDYSNELRSMIKKKLKPFGGFETDTTIEKQLDAMYAFDDWLKDNPKANRNEMRQAANDIAKEYRQARYDESITELELPMHIAKSPHKITEDDLREVATKLRQDLSRGLITKEQMAEQSRLIRQWLAVLGDAE